MTSALVIANADAGSADEAVLAEVCEALRAVWDVRLVRTASPQELTDALREHSSREVVVVAGGDGSLHATVQALYDLERLGEVTVALVPMGTGNDFARTLDLDPDPVAVAKALGSAPVRRLDLCVDDDGGVVVNAAHVGVGAQAGKAAGPWKRRLGPLGYVVGAVKAGIFGRPTRLRVIVDGLRVDRGEDVVQAAVGIGRYVGGGTPLLPDADPADGLLDVSVSHADPPLRRLAYGLRLLRGSHPEHPDVVTVRGRTVTISGEAMTWNADGEIGEGLRTRTWSAVPQAYRMLVPDTENEPLQDG